MSSPPRPTLVVTVLVTAGLLCSCREETKSERVDAVRIPQQQSEFCSTVEKAWADYEALSRQAEAADKNHRLILKQIDDRKTSVWSTRNDDVFRLLGQTKFAFDGWMFKVAKINAPESGRIVVDARPDCSKIAVLHANVAVEPKYVELLTKTKTGDSITLSGKFVQTYGGRIRSPELSQHLERSFTESGSMREPEYTAEIVELK